MFGKDFFPTPPEVVELMLQGLYFENKVVLEPSAGKGNIVDALKAKGAEVLACELNEELRTILDKKCRVIGEDFLSLSSAQVSHIDYIFMNPPFSADETHISHAWEIAPAGCKIIALCNKHTYTNTYSEKRRVLKSVIDAYGSFEDLEDCFKQSERFTGVHVGLIKMVKPGGDENKEFEGFFLDEEGEQEQFNGIMPYNFIRDLVNRYVAAVKVFDKQLDAAVQMNALTSSFYSSRLSMSVSEEGRLVTRADFKKDLQKQAWVYIFDKMDMQKFMTSKLIEEINKFVERQHNVPFTMRNIYHMLGIVIGTQEDRMNKVLLEVFDNLTSQYHENRYNLEGWKTNSHYLVNQKFIYPGLAESGHTGFLQIRYGSRAEDIGDLHKALCWLNGDDYKYSESLYQYVNNRKRPSEEEADLLPVFVEKYQWNTWYEWGYFRFKGFKKGTIHFEFKDEKVWARFNEKVGKLKGFALYENVKTKPKQPVYRSSSKSHNFEVLASFSV